MGLYPTKPRELTLAGFSFENLPMYIQRLYIACMKKLDKKILDKQVDVYLEWGRRTNTVGYMHTKEWLDLFTRHSTKTDIMDVDDEDEGYFKTRIYQLARTPYERTQAEKALRGMRKFYGARGKNATRRDVMGRPPHLGEIEQVQKYRKMGLKLREIERLTGKGISLIHKWIAYPTSKK